MLATIDGERTAWHTTRPAWAAFFSIQLRPSRLLACARALIAIFVAATPEYDPNHGAHNYIGRHGSTTASAAAPVVAPAATSSAETATTSSSAAAATPTDAPGKNATTPATTAAGGSAAAAQATAKAQDKSAGSKGVQVGSAVALLAVSGALVLGF